MMKLLVTIGLMILSLSSFAKPTVRIFTNLQTCEYCRELEQNTLSNPEVRRELGHFRVIRTELGHMSPSAVQRETSRFGVSGLPTILIFDNKGNLERRLTGYVTPPTLLNALRSVEMSGKLRALLTSRIAQMKCMPLKPDEYSFPRVIRTIHHVEQVHIKHFKHHLHHKHLRPAKHHHHFSLFHRHPHKHHRHHFNPFYRIHSHSVIKPVSNPDNGKIKTIKSESGPISPFQHILNYVFYYMLRLEGGILSIYYTLDDLGLRILRL